MRSVRQKKNRRKSSKVKRASGVGPKPGSGEPAPRREQVESQLQRMLASEVLSPHARPAAILKFLVESALEGKTVIERDIRRAVFPVGYKRDSTIVRTTVITLRKLLRQYDDGIGRDDPVLIKLPEPPKGKTPSGKNIKRPRGESYKPLFTYNVRNPIGSNYALGEYFLHRGSVLELAKAAEHFDKVLKLDPVHAGALLGQAEALCAFAMNENGDLREKLISTAGRLVNVALKWYPGFWRTHTAQAAIFYCNRQFDEAGKAFETASGIDRARTLNCGWYAYFLRATGKEEETLALAKSYLDEHIDDAMAHATYAVHLFRTKRLDEAERALMEAMRIDRNCWLAHHLMVCLYVASGRREEALTQAKRLEPLLDPNEYQELMRKLSLDSEKA